LRGNEAALGGNGPCEYVTISNCILSTRCNAFRIGVGNGLVRRCTVSNIIIHNTRTAICLVSQYSKASAGVQIEDIQFSNLRLDCIRPFHIGSTPRGVQEEIAKNIERISFNHVRGTACRGSVISASRVGNIADIRFNDVIFDYGKSENIAATPPEKTGYGEFIKGNPPAAFYLCNAEKVFFKDTIIKFPADDPAWQGAIMGENSKYEEV
jgi:polygalacturonase